VSQGSATGGGLASLAHPDGSTLDIVPAGGNPQTELVTDFDLPTTRPVALAATRAGASAATTAGGPVEIALWDFGSGSWVDIGSCTSTPGRACKVEIPVAGHQFASWDGPSSSAQMVAMPAMLPPLGPALLRLTPTVTTSSAVCATPPREPAGLVDTLAEARGPRRGSRDARAGRRARGPKPLRSNAR
jgi:hypothetical protein